MTQDGQFELTDFLSKKIESKTVMDLRLTRIFMKEQKVK